MLCCGWLAGCLLACLLGWGGLAGWCVRACVRACVCAHVRAYGRCFGALWVAVSLGLGSDPAQPPYHPHHRLLPMPGIVDDINDKVGDYYEPTPSSSSSSSVSTSAEGPSVPRVCCRLPMLSLCRQTSLLQLVVQVCVCVCVCVCIGMFEGMDRVLCGVVLDTLWCGVLRGVTDLGVCLAPQVVSWLGVCAVSAILETVTAQVGPQHTRCIVVVCSPLPARSPCACRHADD